MEELLSHGLDSWPTDITIKQGHSVLSGINPVNSCLLSAYWAPGRASTLGTEQEQQRFQPTKWWRYNQTWSYWLNLPLNKKAVRLASWPLKPDHLNLILESRVKERPNRMKLRQAFEYVCIALLLLLSFWNESFNPSMRVGSQRSPALVSGPSKFVNLFPFQSKVIFQSRYSSIYFVYDSNWINLK